MNFFKFSVHLNLIIVGKYIHYQNTIEKKVKGMILPQQQVKINRVDFPGGPVVKTLCSQCRGPEFDPWATN